MTKTLKLSIVLFVVSLGIPSYSGYSQSSSRLINELTKPSARIGYYWNRDADFEDSKGKFEHAEYTVESGLIAEQFGRASVVIGIRYRFNQMDFKNIPNLQDQDLHAIQLPVDFRYKVEDTSWSWWLRVRPGLFTDFESVNNEDWAFSSIFTGNREISAHLTLSFGAYFSRDFGKDRFFPTLGLVWEPTAKWRINLTPPHVTIAHHPSENWILKLAAYPGGGSWNIDDSTSRKSRDINLRSVRVGLGIERRMYERCWFSIWGGANVRQRVEVLNGGRNVFESDLGASGFGYAGLRITVW